MNAPRSVSLALPLSADGLACLRFEEADEPLSLGKGIAREAGEVLLEAGDESWSAR